MILRVFETPASVASAGADRVSEIASRVEAPVLALATGRTMIPFYRELRERFRNGELDLSRAQAFNLDELAISPEHPASFHSYMERNAWERIGLRRSRCGIPNGSADPEAECRRYDHAVAAAGPFDLAVLGVGSDGHVAYNLPGAVAEECHEVALPEEIAESLGVGRPRPPLTALTLGLGPLRRARRLLLMATGKSKAEAVRLLREGPADPAWPVTLLRDHPAFEILLDEPAAGEAPP